MHTKQVLGQLSYISAIQFLSICLSVCLPASLSKELSESWGHIFKPPEWRFVVASEYATCSQESAEAVTEDGPMLSSPGFLQESSYLLAKLF